IAKRLHTATETAARGSHPIVEWSCEARAAVERGSRQPAARPAGKQTPFCQFLAAVSRRKLRTDLFPPWGEVSCPREKSERNETTDRYIFRCRRKYSRRARRRRCTTQARRPTRHDADEAMTSTAERTPRITNAAGRRE